MKKLALSTAAVFAFGITGMAHAERIQTDLTGYEEVPALSTPAGGQFRAMISNHDQFIDYELEYSDLRGAVTQAHIHFGQHSVNGGIMAWLCGSATNPGPAGTPACPPAGTVMGTIGMAQIVGPAVQGVSAGNLEAAIAAIRAGTAYVNVHSTVWPGGEIRGQIRASARR